MQFNFEGQYDLVKFIKLIAENNMYATLRVGPFIQAEWNHGYDSVSFGIISSSNQYVLYLSKFVILILNLRGLPYWLREVPGITFRSDNEPFKVKVFYFYDSRPCGNLIVRLKFFPFSAPHEKLCYDDHRNDEKGEVICFTRRPHHLSAGSVPSQYNVLRFYILHAFFVDVVLIMILIFNITTQIENEYNTIQLAYREKGDSYVQWAGKLAVGLNSGVPWLMCKQKDAPDPVVSFCMTICLNEK